MKLDEHIYIGFYTATILEWQKLLKPDKYKEIIINSLKFLCEEKRAEVYVGENTINGEVVINAITKGKYIPKPIN